MDDPNLQCIICPKRPQFCDLSHLLTHVASKAHLASQFGLKVRSDANPHAADLLKEYDEWYEARGLGSLLSARLDSKEQRKKRKPYDTPMFTDTQSSKRIKQENPVEPIGFSTPAARSISGCIDPRLDGSYNGSRMKEVASPVTPIRWTAVNSNERTRTGPILRSMQTSIDGKTTEFLPVGNESELGDNNNLSMYPVTPIQFRRKKDAGDPKWMSQETPDPFVESGHRTRTSGKPGKKESNGSRADELARLKGVLWPGMDCFDAATQDMRRRRNQKKDGTVLKQMEITSALIEPSELIFSPSGTFVKERVITGNVEEDTPLKGETPIPPRRQTRIKGALARADPNVPRAMDRKRQKTAAHKGRKIVSDDSAQEAYHSPSLSRRKPALASTYAEYDGEFEMSVNTFRKQAKGGFHVFADEEDGKETYLYQGVEIGPRGQLGTLTPTRLLLNNQPTDSGIRTSKITRTAADKENIEPILNSQGRIGYGLEPHGWHPPFAKRTDADGFGTQYYNESSYLELSGLFHGNDKTGYRSNPLFAPKPPAYDNPFKREEEHANHNVWSSTARAPASEETISGEEQLEFPGLYLIPCTD
jgi:hypothetical protein